jgi:hypothetical protein
VTEGTPPGEQAVPRPPSPGDLAAARPLPGPPPEPATGTGAGGGTGDDRVDAALRRLDGLESQPVSEHVAQYDALHRTLQDALAAIDEG